jgi:hypothetical protein
MAKFNHFSHPLFTIKPHFESHFSAGTYIMFTTIIVSLQLMFGYIGYVVMKKNGYFDDYIN